MSNLSKDIDEQKQKYREIFLKIGEEFGKKLEAMPQSNIENFLNKEVTKEIYDKWLEILNYRKEFQCNRCGACCKLACSEFSPEELKEKAQNGDNFAQQFTSVFIPYEKEEDAQKIYPEYFELLKNNVPDEDVYFYHCPKINDKNECCDYENRPQICKDFPDNPISFLPKTCGYKKWKADIETTALSLNALLEIVQFYKSKF